ncbi:hypothetical protein, partial [Staphylococcus aureus]|uniref:hypothetical protein n=1 Tax=Staphylococcus aureus TaxID=1280 RepID=UPI001C1F4E4D
MASYVTQWKIKNNDKELAIIKLAPYKKIGIKERERDNVCRLLLEKKKLFAHTLYLRLWKHLIVL